MRAGQLPYLLPILSLFVVTQSASVRLLGFLAISSAFIATLASVVVCGVLLLIAGITEVIHAVSVRKYQAVPSA